MMSKQGLLILLVGANLLLLTGLVLVSYTPPTAMAQTASAPAGGPGYALLACQVEIGNDAVYVLDAQNQLLHAFRTPFPHQIGDPVQLIYITTRDLSREFRKEGGQ